MNLKYGELQESLGEIKTGRGVSEDLILRKRFSNEDPEQGRKAW